MSARRLRLLAECLESGFMTEEDRKDWVNDLRRLAKHIEWEYGETEGER